MRSVPGPRYGLVLASLMLAASACVAANSTFWALGFVPFSVIIGVCAWQGMPLAETWERMSEESGEDVGRGPAGLGP